MNNADKRRRLLRITNLQYLLNEPEVRAALSIVKEKYRQEAATLREELEASKRPKKPRWPESTPPEVIDVCNRYWSGTEEYSRFRIHAWNDVAVWTSYPSGGYYDNGGYHPASPSYCLISRTEYKYNKPNVIKIVNIGHGENETTRMTPKMMADALAEVS